MRSEQAAQSPKLSKALKNMMLFIRGILRLPRSSRPLAGFARNDKNRKATGKQHYQCFAERGEDSIL